MKKFLVLVLLILSVDLICSSTADGAKCICPDSNCAIVTVPYNNKSSSFNLNINIITGTKVIVQQEECKTCGYTLDFVAANCKDKSYLTYVGKSDGQTSNQLMAVGGNNLSCFTFNVLKSGTANIPFFYYRPWERALGSRSIVVINIVNDTNGKSSVQANVLTDNQILVLDNSQDTSTTTQASSSRSASGTVPANSGSSFVKVLSKMIFVLLIIIFY